MALTAGGTSSEWWKLDLTTLRETVAIKRVVVTSACECHVHEVSKAHASHAMSLILHDAGGLHLSM
jgi:hypothetical protein